MSTLSTPRGGSYRAPTLEHATVGDAMHPGVMACDPDASLTEVARMMATHHIHCIAVMGVSLGNAGEALTWGVITDQDVVRGAVHGKDVETARTLAGHPVMSVEPGMPLREAAALLLTCGCAHALVISPDTQHPVGVLSTLDVAGVMAWGEA